MTLDQLEAVHAVVEKGSFRAAAEHLHRSQPALSASVKTLEDAFGFQIFDRSTYRPTLTEEGTIFVNASRATLESARLSARVAKELGRREYETKLRVSIDPLTPITAVEIIAFECSRPVIPVVLILENTIMETGHKLVLEGQVDLAIGPSTAAVDGIERIPVTSVKLRGVASRRLLQEQRAPDAAFLDRHPQILVYDRAVDEPDGLSKERIYAGNRPKIFAPDHATKLHLITCGLGWGRLTEAEIAAGGQAIVTIDESLCSHLDLHLSLMRSKERDLGPVGRAIWKAFSSASCS